MEQFSHYFQQIVEMAIAFAPSLLLAALVLAIGLWIIRRLEKVLRRTLERANFADNIAPFLVSIAGIGLKILLLFSVAGIVGIEIASFVAVLAAAGFAIGLALQGSLGNFAAGVIILIFQPYRRGDWVEVQEKFGRVEEIQIFNTLIVTPGQKLLIIPNGQVIEGIVTNYSAKGFIRIELNVTMPYEESFPKVKEIVLEVLRATPKVLADPVPEVGIESFDSHSVVLGIRPYVHPDDYWEVTFAVHEGVKKAFHDANIKVAYSEGVEMGVIGE